MSFFGGLLNVGLSDQSFNGVATFNPLLGLIDQLSVAGLVAGVAGGPGNTLYLGSGRTVYQYDSAGNILGSVSGSTTTQIIDLDLAVDETAPIPEPSTMLLVGAIWRRSRRTRFPYSTPGECASARARRPRPRTDRHV